VVAQAAWPARSAAQNGSRRSRRVSGGTVPAMAASGLVAAAAVGQRAQQRLGIGVARRGEELGRRRHLDDLAGVHQRHPVRHARHHRQVVRDQQQAHALLALQVLQQVEDLLPGW
jgi:hypothetical protein